MRVKQRPTKRGSSVDMTRLVGGQNKAGSGLGDLPPKGCIIPFFGNKSNFLSGFSRQNRHKSRINKRILAIIAHVMDMAAGGALGWWLVDTWGVRALPLMVAALVITLSVGLKLRLMIGGGK